MNQPIENTRIPTVRRASYEAPCLTVVELQPEEQLLGCGKMLGNAACHKPGVLAS